jgi:hypothetical protein
MAEEIWAMVAMESFSWYCLCVYVLQFLLFRPLSSVRNIQPGQLQAAGRLQK